MTSRPSDGLARAANALYDAINKAKAGGYVILVDRYGFIDLMEPETGDRTPVSSAKMED